MKEYKQYTARNDLLGLIPDNARVILDVGCGTGLLAKALLQRKKIQIYGVELSKSAAKKSRKYLKKVIVGDVERVNLNFPKNFFDCIVYTDVLEHLLEPEKLLKKHRALLKDEGCIVLSIPNVSYIKIIWGLLHGEWFLTDVGILYKGHLRFFTFKTIERMLNKAGYIITVKEDKIRPLKPRIDIFNVLFHAVNFF